MFNIEQIGCFALRMVPVGPLGNGWKMVGEHRYVWEESYLAAILETDNLKLSERIDDANAAFKSSLNELALDHGGTSDEQIALINALDGLLGIMRERLTEW